MSESRDDSHYLHGTAPAEQARLSRLNDLINKGALDELALRPGQRVLDVGSGLGQLTRGMGRQVGPTGRVVGIERSPEQLAEARRQAELAGEAETVEFRQGDATRLPLTNDEWGTFDVVHARFVLEHVTDPVAVVREMVRAVRPGGRVVLEDDAHDTFRLWPEPPGFGRLWASYLRTYDRVGNDPLIGHRLVSLLHQAGAAPVRNTWLFFGSCAGHPGLGAYVENLVRILNGVRQPIFDVGEVDAAGFDAGLAALREWGQRPDAAMWYAVSWAEGRRTLGPIAMGSGDQRTA
jgi:ubiquinone/menaquinone biosynthesis C-methylase UbiE